MFVHPLPWSLAFDIPRLRLSGCRPRRLPLLPQRRGCSERPGSGFSSWSFLTAAVFEERCGALGALGVGALAGILPCAIRVP